MAYAIKMASKAGGRDYKVAPLEGQWWADDETKLMVEQLPSAWKWKLLIRVPEFITEQELSAALTKIQKKKDRPPAVDLARLVDLEEGRCVQMLHVGPYTQEEGTIAAMEEFARSQGWEFAGRHHEIYISDPNRVAPEKLKTILRYPIRPRPDEGR